MKVAERKRYRELKLDLIEAMDVSYTHEEKQKHYANAVCIECDVKDAEIDLKDYSAVTFNLQYSYQSLEDDSTGHSNDSHKSIEVQLTAVYDRTGEEFELKPNQKAEIEKLIEGKIEI